MRSKKLIFTAMLFLSLLYTPAASAASVVGSKHDLSISNRNQPCAFCHTPHFASTIIAAPLWNKNIANLDTVTFTMYTSPTIDTTIPDRPSALSLACLSCHDGVGGGAHAVINEPGSGLGTGSYAGKCSRCHTPHSATGMGAEVALLSPQLNIGPNLGNDHPISMAYPTAARDLGFFIPPSLQKGWADLPLFGGKVECASCHNVHDPTNAPFLRMSNSGSALCYKCHNK